MLDTCVPDFVQRGKAPLMVAVEKGNEKFVKLLLAKGADVNAANTVSILMPLHLCSE